MNNPTIAIIQARMASSRLPGKVLLDIGGEPMLARVVTRARRAQTLEAVIIATSCEPADDPVADFCRQQGYPLFRGSLHDVLDRYYQAARRWQAGTIVRITADCPVIDPDLINETVRAYRGSLAGMDGSAFDFAANRLPPPWGRSYPIGLDVEVCSFAALETAWELAHQSFHREHVMPYFYEEAQFTAAPVIYWQEHAQERSWEAGNSPRGFRLVCLQHHPDHGAQRWTVDTAEDLALLREIYARFESRDDFTWQEVLALFAREPELARLNRAVYHKDYRAVDERQHASPPPKPENDPDG